MIMEVKSSRVVDGQTVYTGFRANKDGSRWFNTKLETQGIDQEHMLVMSESAVVRELEMDFMYGWLVPAGTATKI